MTENYLTYLKSFLAKYIKPDIVKAITSVLIVLSGLKNALILLGFLIVFDFVTGILASIKRGERILSSRMLNTVVKLYVYYGAIVTLAIVDASFGTHYLTHIAVGFSVVTEAKSVLENLAVYLPDILNLKKYLNYEKNKQDNNPLQ